MCITPLWTGNLALKADLPGWKPLWIAQLSENFTTCVCHGQDLSFLLFPEETLSRDAGQHGRSSCGALSDWWHKPGKLGKFSSVFIECGTLWGNTELWAWVSSCQGPRHPSCATDIWCYGLGTPSQATSLAPSARELNTHRGLCMSQNVSTLLPAWDQVVPPAPGRTKKGPGRTQHPPHPAAGCSRRSSICTDATGWTRACNPKLKPSEAFFYPFLSRGKGRIQDVHWVGTTMTVRIEES